MSEAPKQHMNCAVCGAYAGLFQQWHNRDTGYGVCKDCVTWLTEKRNVGPEELKQNYGIAGVNYEGKRVD